MIDTYHMSPPPDERLTKYSSRRAKKACLSDSENRENSMCVVPPLPAPVEKDACVDAVVGVDAVSEDKDRVDCGGGGA